MANLLTGLQKMLPITFKMNPFNGRNLLYLAQIAVLTRIATGIVRVNQNKPSKLKDPRLSENEKRLAFIERFFVEIVGTLGYMFCLHFGQDAVSKVFEKKAAYKVPELAKDTVNFTKTEIAQANTALKDVYGTEQRGLMHRILYGEQVVNAEGKKVIQKANLNTLREKLGTELFEKVLPKVEQFSWRSNVAATLCILGGVGLSALFGGVVTQWVNDRVTSPLAGKFLAKRYPADPGNLKLPGSPEKENLDRAQKAGVLPMAYKPGQPTLPQPVAVPGAQPPAQAAAPPLVRPPMAPAMSPQPLPAWQPQNPAYGPGNGIGGLR